MRRDPAAAVTAGSVLKRGHLQRLVHRNGVAGDVGAAADPDRSTRPLAGQVDHRPPAFRPGNTWAVVFIRPPARWPLIVVVAPVLLTLPTVDALSTRLTSSYAPTRHISPGLSYAGRVFSDSPTVTGNHRVIT